MTLQRLPSRWRNRPKSPPCGAAWDSDTDSRIELIVFRFICPDSPPTEEAASVGGLCLISRAKRSYPMGPCRSVTTRPDMRTIASPSLPAIELDMLSPSYRPDCTQDPACVKPTRVPLFSVWSRRRKLAQFGTVSALRMSDLQADHRL